MVPFGNCRYHSASTISLGVPYPLEAVPGLDLSAKSSVSLRTYLYNADLAIFLGNISRFSDVKKKTREKSRSKATEAPAVTKEPSGAAPTRGRGRGGHEITRGGRGRGSDRSRGGGHRKFQSQLQCKKNMDRMLEPQQTRLPYHM